MGKGEATRDRILDEAIAVASVDGITGLTLGRLAESVGMSKSGLFAHFRSKEALQIQVLDHAAASFAERVVRPALQAPRGEPRVRALFEGWLGWAQEGALPGGCVFVAAASELDDRPGSVRDRLVELQREWVAVLAGSVARGVEAGAFRRDADPEQFAQDFYGVILARHHTLRLLGDERADLRARRALEALIAAARTAPT